jgi:hypothetical protein
MQNFMLDYFLYIFRIAIPIKYKISIASDKHSCVIGSVEGVTIAPIIVDPTSVYFQSFSIWPLVTTFVKPKTTCKSGIWNVTPVVKNKRDIKFRYSSKDQRGSTKSEL